MEVLVERTLKMLKQKAYQLRKRAMKMFIRIDDRLVHGQVVTAWLRHLNAKTIIVADDIAATNPILRKALQLATPKAVNLILKTVAEAADEISNLQQEDVMIVVKQPLSAKQIIEASPTKSWELNVGNVGAAEGRKKCVNTVYLDEKNHEALKTLSESGVNTYFQTVPSESKQKFK